MPRDILRSLEEVGHSDDARHYQALSDLAEGGDAMRDQVIALLPTATRHQRWQCVTVLACIRDSVSQKILLTVVRDDPDAVLRGTAIPALKGATDTETVAVLITALKDTDDIVRRWAASHLGEAKSPASVPALKAALRDRDEWVRLHAAGSLRFTSAPEARSQLEDLGANAWDKAVRRCARQALHEWDHPKAP